MGNTCATSKVTLSFDSEDGMEFKVTSAEKQLADEAVDNASIETDRLMTELLELQALNLGKADRARVNDLAARAHKVALAKYPDMKLPIVQAVEAPAPTVCDNCGRGKEAPAEEVKEAEEKPVQE